MSYTTVHETSNQNKVILLKNLFEQNNIRYQVLDESTNTNFPIGARVQVHENDVKRAEGLMIENGFLQDRATGPRSVSRSKFWLWFVIAIICLAVAAFLITTLMQE